MRRALVIAIGATLVLACGPKGSGTQTTDYRAFTEHYAFNITSEPSPPHAREKTLFKIRVRDKTSSQPIEGGEGIIYGNTEDNSGKTFRAMAMLVIGPTAIRTSSPGRSFANRMIAAGPRSGARGVAARAHHAR